jgi:hypothetical protein
MDILELTNSQPEANGGLEKSNFMNMRKLKARESLKDKLLGACEKPDAPQNVGGLENAGAVDNLIRGLVDLLPQPDGLWRHEDRAKWLRLAAGIFDLCYKAGDAKHLQIAIGVVKRETITR